MRDFAYHRPASLEEVFDLMERYGEDARVIAGGTALVNMMRHGLVEYPHLISLYGVAGLSAISSDNDGLYLGAAATHAAVETAPQVLEGWPMLAATYHHVGSVRIRNVATVGGGLAHADPNQDPPPSLIALGAQVRVASKHGQRTISVEELFRDYYETTLRPGELITEIIVPPIAEGSGTSFIKFLPRTSEDYATVSAAALVRLNGDGVCEEARVAVGSAGPVPLRAKAVEEALLGQSLSQTAIGHAAALVRDIVDPIDDGRGSAGYKRDMAVVITRRVVEEALERGQG